eukprot:2235748-Prymnesium_polylepis.1
MEFPRGDAKADNTMVAERGDPRQLHTKRSTTKKWDLESLSQTDFPSRGTPRAVALSSSSDCFHTSSSRARDQPRTTSRR